MQKEHRLSFCINLEVVIFQDSEFGLFFGRSFETIICFQNLLTFINVEYGDGNARNVPIDCKVGEWGPCSATCGKGRQVIQLKKHTLSQCIFCTFNVMSKTFLVYFLNSKELLSMKL